MLDDRAGRFAGERIGGEQRAFEVEKIIEREFLAAQLTQGAEPGARFVNIERGVLAGVLAIPQRLLVFERNRETLGEPVAALCGKPACNRGVVRGRVLKDLGGEGTAQIAGVSTRHAGGDRREHTLVICGVHHRVDALEVLGCRANHGRSANVDLFNHLVRCHASAARGGAERIEVHADEIDGLNAVGRDRGHVFGQIASREQATMHGGVERLHAPVEHLGELRHGAHIGARNAGVANRLGGAASGE